MDYYILLIKFFLEFISSKYCLFCFLSRINIQILLSPFLLILQLWFIFYYFPILFWFAYKKDNRRKSLGPSDLRSGLFWIAYTLNLESYDSKAFWKYLKEYNLKSIDLEKDWGYIANTKQTNIRSFLIYLFEDIFVKKKHYQKSYSV